VKFKDYLISLNYY